MGIYTTLNSRWYRKARKRAMKDPTYAAIQARRDAGSTHSTVLMLSDDHNLGLGEWKLQDEIVKKMTRYPIHLKVLAWRHRHLRPYRWCRGVISTVQRARRGWSHADTWDFHSFHSRLMVEAIEHMRVVAHGHPGDLTQEQWDGILAEIRDGFRAAIRLDDCLEDHDDEEDKKLRAEFEHGMDLFKLWYFALWD